MHSCTAQLHSYTCTPSWYTGTHYTDTPLRLIHRHTAHSVHNAQLHCTATHYIAAQATNTQTTQLQHIKPRTGQHTAEASSQQDVQAAFTHQPNTSNTFAFSAHSLWPTGHSFRELRPRHGSRNKHVGAFGCIWVFVGNV